jgi:hypothetical protein
MVKKQEPLEWAVLPASKAVTAAKPDSDHDYDLLNAKIGEALLYGERMVGINLVWGDPANSNNVRFARQSGSTDAIKYGEMLAINIRRGGWLRHGERDWGINLKWSDTPVYEWRIDGGAKGSAVGLKSLVTLYNKVEDDWLMYVPRDFGINLRWSADREAARWFGDAVTITKIAKKYWDKLP